MHLSEWLIAAQVTGVVAVVRALRALVAIPGEVGRSARDTQPSNLEGRP